MEKKPSNCNKNTGFTHFISLPLIEADLKTRFESLQKKIYDIFPKSQQKALSFNNPNLFHITLSMLCLTKESHRLEAEEIFKRSQDSIAKILSEGKIRLKLGKVLSFSKKLIKEKNTRKVQIFKKKNSEEMNKRANSVIYLEILEDENLKKIMRISHLLIKEFIDKEIIDVSELKAMKVLYDHNIGCFRAEKFHLTLFRVGEELDYEKMNKEFEGFEFGEIECGSIDISTRFEFEEDQFYKPLYRIKI